MGEGPSGSQRDDLEASGCVQLAKSTLLGLWVSWVLYFDKVGLVKLLRLLLLVCELQLQTSEGTILFVLSLFVEIVNTLANATHDSCSHIGLLKELGLRELVVSDCHLRPVRLEVVRFKEEWQDLSDGALANHLVQPVLLEVLLEVEDRDRLRERLLHLHNLRPEHGRLVLLGAVAVIVDAVVIGALGFVIVPAAALPEEAAQLALYELHGTDNFWLVSKRDL